MSPRQLLFLAAVGLLSLLAAIFTGPMVVDALLGSTKNPAPPVETPDASPAPPHPAAQP